MKFDFLHYIEKTSSLSYGTSPPGTLSVERFINDEPCWQQESTKSVLIKKTLVIADFGCKTYHSYKFRAYIRGVETLLEEGFTIYAWQEGAPLLLEKGSAHIQLKKKALDSSDAATILEAMAHHNVAADTIQILDYIACRKLFFHEHEARVETHGSKLNELIAKLHTLALNELVVVNTHYSNYYYSKIISELPAISKGKRELKLIEFDHHGDIDKFLQEHTHEDLKSLEAVHVCYTPTFTTKTLAELGKRAPLLKELAVLDRTLANEDVDLNLSSLEKLWLSYCKIDRNILRQLFLQAQNLHSIRLYECKKLDETIFEGVRFDHLEKVVIENIPISTQFLAEILKRAPMLSTLRLVSCRETLTEFSEDDICQISCRNLTKLHIINCKILPNTLCQLVERTEKRYLKTVIFDSLEMPLALFESILAQSKTLRNVRLSSCKFTGESSRQSIILDHLESLYLSATYGILFSIIEKATRLKKLSLESCVADDEDLSTKLTLEHLEVLHCQSSRISAELLECAPNLENLDLSQCKLIEEGFERADFYLPKLRLLTCDYIGYTNINQVLQLLQRTPNLEELHFSIRYNEDLFDPELIEEIFLPKLKLVKCWYLPKALVQQIRSCSPNVIFHGYIDIDRTDSFSTALSLDSNESYYVDASTGPSKETLSITRIFEAKDGNHPDVNYYRLKSYDSLDASSVPFRWYNAEKMTLTSCDTLPLFIQDKAELDAIWNQIRDPQHTFYLATYDMPATGMWLPLPSWHPEEQITHIIASGEILYSKNENFYYLNLSSTETKVYYIIKVPELLSTTALDPRIQNLIKKYREDFSEGELEGEESIESIIKEQKGACRHRAAGFFYEMETLFPYTELSMSTNGVHDFIFCKKDKRFVRCCVGGSDQELEINESNHTDLFNQTIQISPTSSENKSVVEHFKRHILPPGKRSIIEVHSQEELGFTRKTLGHHYYASSLRELRECSASQKVVVINLSQFDTDELAQICEERFPSHMCIIGLYIIGGSFCELTKELISFFDAKLELLPFTPGSTTAPCPLKPTASLERLVLKTLWNIPENSVKPFTLTFEPSNIAELAREVHIPGKNVHIGFHSQEELDLAAYWLQEELKTSFYIDKPNEIRTASRWIDANGTIHQGPGGPLFEYITRSPDPTLIINFSSFEVEDLVRCNSIIDTEYREADGTRLPDRASVIGLSVVGPHSYTEADFTGRFYSRVRIHPFYRPYPIEFRPSGGSPIDLYGINDWKTALTGKWELKGDRMRRKRGPLEKGVTALEIQNGPWENRDFRHFWLQKSLTYNLQLSVSSNCSLEQFTDTFQWVDKAERLPFILNPTTASKLWTEYKIENELLDTLPGIIKANKGQDIYAILTRPLLDGQWYRLLSLCKKENVRLNLLSIPPIEQISPTIPASYDRLIHITECDGRILYGIDATIDANARFRFTHKNGCVAKFLEEGKHVVLKGRFSDELLDLLMPLLLNPAMGKLTLVPETYEGTDHFTTMSPLHIPIPKHLSPLDKERLRMVIDALNRDRHVCIEGETAVGKTTFILKVLSKIGYFFVTTSLHEWAACPKGIIPLLFIDESNTQGKSFNWLEGIYTGGVVDEAGNYLELDERHRVIFCQNPKSYGGERKEIEFLKRHPNTITFTALPLENLGIAPQLLEVHKKVPELSPRELEMMALMPSLTYSIAKCALPKEKQAEFTNWFKKSYTLPTFEGPRVVEDFTLTESRKELYCLMRDLLSIRKKRLQGGLGSLVIEGMPGDGKTHFAEAVLKAHGFTKVQTHEIGRVSFDAYCKIPANMALEDKRACLLAAFHAGQVVFEDEANTAASLESLNNALLMGHDEEMQPAKQAGFFKIRTQNPISMKGRRATTKASKRRSITYECPRYPQKEVYQIIQNRYPELSQELIRDLTQKKLTIRELLQLVERGLNTPKHILPHSDMREQQGPCCKLYALSYAIQILSHTCLPARKRDTNSRDSLRALAKREKFSEVGEIYDPNYLVALANQRGFSSTKIIETNSDSYIEKLKRSLDKGHAPIIFFDVDSTGKPILAKSRNEHAAVCIGYFFSLQSELYFTIMHWGKPWVVKASELRDSADNLAEEREQETFYKVASSWRSLDDRQNRAQHDLDRSITDKTYSKVVTPQRAKATFRNKFIVIA